MIYLFRCSILHYIFRKEKRCFLNLSTVCLFVKTCNLKQEVAVIVLLRYYVVKRESLFLVKSLSLVVLLVQLNLKSNEKCILFSDKRWKREKKGEETKMQSSWMHAHDHGGTIDLSNVNRAKKHWYRSRENDSAILTITMKVARYQTNQLIILICDVAQFMYPARKDCNNEKQFVVNP